MKSIVLIGMVLLVSAGETAANSEATPASAFERFKTLEGTWRGKSTRGWEEDSTIKSIAGGSVVVFSSFDAHPGEQMLTLVHMDGDRLMLTHYCVAKNQPRLTVTSIEDEGSRVTFTFHDATNLTGREQGHMDKVVYRFHDDGHFSSRWTWYQDGEERWMEEIQYHRVESER